MIAHGYQRASMVLASNESFDEWGETFVTASWRLDLTPSLGVKLTGGTP